MRNKEITVQVLVVGAEAAGARAAIAAAENPQVQVGLVTKGSDIARAGATVTATTSVVAVDSRSVANLLGLPGGDAEDNGELFFEDIVLGGQYLNDQPQVEALVQEIPRRAKELKDWGYRWDKVMGPAPGHRYPRACYGYPDTGPAMLKILKRVIKEKRNIQFLPNLLVTDLLMAEGRVSGAVGLDLITGNFLMLRAKAVILATGGGQNIYPYVSGPHDLTGDGQAMAYRAGAELVDPEMIQFIPAALLWPPGWDFARHGPMPVFLDGRVKGGQFLNRKGERYLERWDPERLEGTTRDIWAIAAAHEIAEGRGSKHGGVYFSIKGVPDNIIDFFGEWGPYKGWKSSTGFDYRPLIEMMKKGLAVELGIYCHFFMGGINIDEHGRTNLPGLLAAGECTGLVHGANRLSGVALAQTLVQGYRAGRGAQEEVLVQEGKPFPNLNPLNLKRLKERVFHPLKNQRGPDPISFRKRLQKLAYEKVGVLRDEAGLGDALKEIEMMREELPALATRAKIPRYNLEWVEAIQAANMLNLLEVIAQAARMRTESRGAHYRRDHPYTDNDNWLKHIHIRREESKAVLHTVPVPITRIQPPKGVTPYPDMR